MFKCHNPLCDRQVTSAEMYCCPPCQQAHGGKYEIHEPGSHPAFCHTPKCNARNTDRGPWTLDPEPLPLGRDRSRELFEKGSRVEKLARG